MDTSKRIFQLHGVDSAEQPILRKKLSRNAMRTFFERLAPTVVAIEACGAAHYWAEVSKVPPAKLVERHRRGGNSADWGIR